MNRLISKHKYITSVIFSIIILEWYALGNMFSITISRWNIFISTSTVFTALCISMLWFPMLINPTIPKRKVNAYEIFLNSVLPLLLLYPLRILDYSIIPVLIFLVMTIILTMGIVYLQKIAHVKKIRVIYYLRHILTIGIVVVIIPCHLYFKYDKPVHEYSEELTVKEDCSAGTSLDNDELKKIFFNCEWDTLSNEERSEMLYEIIKFEADKLGIPAPRVYLSNDMHEFTLGSYDNTDKIIRINNYQLGKRSQEDSLSTAMHELYHAYQNSVVELYLDLPENYKANSYFDKAAEWMMADENYAKDHQNPNTYENNLLEVDARAFAEKKTDEYLGIGNDAFVDALEDNFDDLFGNVE